MSQKVAYVTGGMGGIGTAICQRLHKDGFKVIAGCGPTRDREKWLSEQSRQGYSFFCSAGNVADWDSTVAAFDATIAEHGTIDVLVNNAGYGVTGYFDEQPWPVHAAFIQVLMTAPTELAYRLLPGMKARGYGRIVNVASLAGHVPGSAGHTLYAASKAYLIRFSQSLALEGKGTGVHATAVCPGFTYSEFHDVTGSRALVSRMPSFMWMDAPTVARQGLDAVEAGKAVYVNGRVNRLIKGFFKLIPDALALKLVERQGRRFRTGPHRG